MLMEQKGRNRLCRQHLDRLLWALIQHVRMHNEHTYNAFYVVRVNPKPAYNYD